MKQATSEEETTDLHYYCYPLVKERKKERVAIDARNNSTPSTSMLLLLLLLLSATNYSCLCSAHFNSRETLAYLLIHLHHPILWRLGNVYVWIR